MSLKLASLDDLPDYLRMCREFYEESAFYPSIEYSEEKVHAFLLHALATLHTQAVVLLYEENAKVVGMIVGFASETPFSDDKIASELAWWVDEEYRGTRGSLELVFAYEEWAKRVGCKHATMALLPSLTNPKIEGYYERLGYKKTEISYIKEL